MKKTLYIEEYSANIPLFLNKDELGFVHSVFENGMNIKLGKRLLFIGTTKNGRLPFGAHISKNTFTQLLLIMNSRENVRWDAKRKILIFNNGNVLVSFDSAKIYESMLIKSKNISNIINNFELILKSLLSHADETGLQLPIEQFVKSFLNEKHSSENLNSELFYQLNNLTKVLFTNDETECITTLRYFLGRGQGLTPSGDDHIVGLLALQSLGIPFEPTFKRCVASLIEKESITTDVASEYLYYAVNGLFSSTVIDVLEHLIMDTNKKQESIEQLLAVGHSSGVDVLFGILIGLLALRRKSYV